MTKDTLYEYAIQDFKNDIDVDKIHPLHKAIIEECCENAINNSQNVTDKETLKYATHVAFLTSLSTLKKTLKASLEFTDEVNLNYRNQSFVIGKNSKVLK